MSWKSLARLESSTDRQSPGPSYHRQETLLTDRETGFPWEARPVNGYSCPWFGQRSAPATRLRRRRTTEPAPRRGWQPRWSYADNSGGSVLSLSWGEHCQGTPIAGDRRRALLPADNDRPPLSQGI